MCLRCLRKCGTCPRHSGCGRIGWLTRRTQKPRLGLVKRSRRSKQRTENRGLEDLLAKVESERDAERARLAERDETTERLKAELKLCRAALQSAQARLEERGAIIDEFRNWHRQEEQGR